MNKVVFYIMNKKGYEVFLSFLNHFDNSQIEYVVLSRDKNLEKDYFNEIKSLCEENHIKFYMKNDSIPNFWGYKFAVGWRWLISDTNKLIILHDSILPKYRGFSPLVNMLINGEDEIGVTALFASEQYDKGDIILQEKVSIDYPIKIDQAIMKISKLYSNIVINICKTIFSNGSLVATTQDEDKATYSLWRDEEDYYINWHLDSSIIKRTIDALSFPFKGAKSLLNGEIVTIVDAEVCEEKRIENRHVGKIIFLEKDFPVVVCGTGLLKITEIIDSNNKSILPLKKFRSRFEGRK
ncbi:formyltransferase family protein [Bacillus salipaludis]|uniref:formyltransferase family protein n=1 Tax=Bacillus salipaludis TaxID=2547811 RepID=UPI003D2593B3